jgi:hypothetical protein
MKQVDRLHFNSGELQDARFEYILFDITEWTESMPVILQFDGMPARSVRRRYNCLPADIAMRFEDMALKWALLWQ